MKALPLLAALAALPGTGPGEAPHTVAAEIVEALEARDKDAFQARLYSDLDGDQLALVDELYGSLTRPGITLTPSEDAVRGIGRSFVGLTAVGSEGDERELFLLLRELADGWRLEGSAHDARLAREWLWELGKHGAAAQPADLLEGFFVALKAGVEEAAERACTNDCWDGYNETAREIFRVAQAAELEFHVESMESKADRVLARVQIGVAGLSGSEKKLYFYLVKRPGGWLIGGYDDEPTHKDAFLAGRAGANPWPKNAEGAVDRLATAINERTALRLRNICTATCLEEDAGGMLAFYSRLTRARQSVRKGECRETHHGRSVAQVLVLDDQDEPVEMRFLMLTSTPDGWRVQGSTEDETVADEFYTGDLAPSDD